MNLLPIYTLIIFMAQKFVNSGEVTYYGDCKPPDGFTIGTYSTSSLLPIEKCCPQTDPCDEIQGSCTLKWALELWPRMCDHMTYDCKDFQCVCCVKCSEDKCSKCTETRGECKKECRPDEVEDRANPCSFAKCKCCKKCDIQPECQDAGGKCVGSYADCPTGSISSNTGCCGGCFCCKPACQPLPACSQVEGAYCSETEHCSGGFYACHGLCLKTKWKSGYEAIEKCYCCIPKLLAVDTSDGVDGGGRPHGGYIPINPHRDEAKRPNKVEKVQIITNNITEKIEGNEMIKEDSDQPILFPKEVKANKKDLEKIPVSTGSLNINNNKLIEENHSSLNAKRKYQALQTNKKIKKKSTIPDQKDILEAIDILKKLLFKNKSNTPYKNLKLNEKNGKVN